jgi:hypothetical protein
MPMVLHQSTLGKELSFCIAIPVILHQLLENYLIDYRYLAGLAVELKLITPLLAPFT